MDFDVTLGEWTFKYPIFLLFILLLPLIGKLYNRFIASKTPQARLSSLQGLQAVSSWKSQSRRGLFVLRLFAFVCFLMAMARPQSPQANTNITTEGIDIVMAMDISSSMLAMDFDPNRLEASKKVAANFIDQRVQDRIGLVVFAGESFTQCPLTTDHSILKDLLFQLECGVLQDGTAMGMGLASAINRLKESQAKSKIIILLTDGINNTGDVQPLTAAKIAQEFGIKVYTIGVGTEGKARAPVMQRSDGQFVFGVAEVQIDEALLEQIAEETGGRYFRATNMEKLVNIYATIDKLERTKIESTSIRRYNEEFHYFVWVGLVFLLIEFFAQYYLLRSTLEHA